MSQRLGTQNRQEGQIGQLRATISHAICPKHLQAGSRRPHTRLRCVGFQAAGAPAPGRQTDSKDQPIASRPTLSKDLSSTGQQPRPAAVTPKQAVPVEARGALQEASGNAVAAKQQDAERMQAAEEASTSGREYWQVMRPYLLFKAHKLALNLNCSRIMGSALPDTAAAHSCHCSFLFLSDQQVT